MNKAELHAFAAAGVAQKVAAIEQELAIYHREWPEMFLSPTAPQLLKAPLRNGNGTGHWPIVATKPAPETAGDDAVTIERLLAERKVHAQRLKASWTPARRAKMARLMKQRSKAIHKAKAAKRAVAKTGGSRRGSRLGGPVVDGIHAYLQAHGESSLKDLMAGVKKGASNVVTCMAAGLKSGRFTRVSKGRYALGPHA
jgi:hypothetical protein